MTSAHPSAERLERFMSGRLPRGESPEVLRHLVSGCAECSATTTRLWEVLVTGRQAQRPDSTEYEAAFDRAWARANIVHAQLAREREVAPARCEELLAIPRHQQRLRFTNDARFQTLPLCEALIEASQRALFDDAAGAAELATLAREVADHLSSDRYGAATVADVKAAAWASYANAVRETSDFEQAEDALRKARTYLEEGTGNPSEKAKFLSSLANVLIEKGRMDEFLVASRKLEAIYSKLGDQHMLGRVQLKKAYAFFKRQDPERAIQLLTRALELLDPNRDPRRRVFALHNLTDALIDAGRWAEAEGHMALLSRLHTEQGDRLNLLRFRWLEARLAHAKNDLEAAAELFSEVRNRFIELEIGFDVALVSMDLSEVLWQQGAVDESQRRLREAIPILKALGVHTEAIAAMAFLEQAVRVQTVSRALVRQTAAFVRQVQIDPTIRFQPAQLGQA